MIRTLLISLLLLAPAAATAQTRVALLIGEGAYPAAAKVGDYRWPDLPNPPHDVDLVAKKLKQVGFDTTLAVNLGRADLKKAIAAFAAKAANADDAVVYYAGHGFEYARHNYLVPIDAPTQADTAHLGDAFIDLDEVTAAASKARRINIFFLDACRTRNSLVRLSGITKPYVDDVEFKPGAQVAVVYSTARGTEAYDRGVAAPPPLEYSPFAWYVAQYVGLPRTSLGDVFTFINAKVQESTRPWGPQTPYMLSSLTQTYYFRPAGALASRPPSVEVTAGPTSPQAVPRSDRGAAALDLPLDYLARTDEPAVVAHVLAEHTAEELVTLAEGGDPMAAYLLGYMFEFGRGAQQDLVQARVWLETAAKSGLAPAQLELAYFLEHHGQGPDDIASGRTLMEAAAAQGFAKAQAHLANLLMNDGSRSDYDRGVQLYRAAAAQGYPQALYALAVLKDAEARVGLAALASSGDMASHQWLCELAAGNGGVGAALADCTAAAEAGYALSQARLAIAYHDGDGVTADPDEARHWARLALAQPDLRDDLRARVQALGS